MRLSVTIAAKNEENNLRRCLNAVKWADEIVVVDDMSSDKTAEICNEYNTVFSRNDSHGDFHKNKNLAIEKATGEWILSLDADEVITPELADEIREVIKSETMIAYYLNRRNFFLGKWIRGCGWYPDHIIRLFRKGVTRWPWQIHDIPKVKEKNRVGYLKNPLLHYSYVSLDQYLEKFSRYTSRVGLEYYAQGKRLKWYSFPAVFVIRPALIFLRKYFFLKGFRDGFRGLFISFSAASTEFVAYAKLWELQERQEKQEATGKAFPGQHEET